MWPLSKNPKRNTVLSILDNCRRFLIRWRLRDEDAEWIEDKCFDDYHNAVDEAHDVAGYDVGRVQIVDQFTGHREFIKGPRVRSA